MQKSFSADIEKLDAGYLVTSPIFGGRIALGKDEDLRGRMRDLIHQAIDPVLSGNAKNLFVTVSITDVTVAQVMAKVDKTGGK